MGVMKDLHTTIRNGGDEAVAAVQRMGEDWRAQLEQAAAEIERLRGYRDNAESDAAIAHLLVDRYRMTDEERQAVELAYGKLTTDARYTAVAATLRGMLDRTATPHATSAQASTPDGCTVQNDGSECKRRADYGKWLRTPYCEGHGCQCGGGGE